MDEFCSESVEIAGGDCFEVFIELVTEDWKNGQGLGGDTRAEMRLYLLVRALPAPLQRLFLLLF